MTLSGDYWQLTLTDNDGCVLAVLRKSVDDFDCCGTNTGWTADAYSVCDLDATLAPDPCTCCPTVPDCPPDGDDLCTNTDCCLANNCTLSVTISGLATIPTIPPGNEPPDEACGGMNGVYACVYVSDCTWRYYGNPANQSSPPGKVAAELTLSGHDWTFTLRGPDGQTARFTSVGWDCNPGVVLEYAGGSCPVTSPAPSGSFGVVLN